MDSRHFDRKSGKEVTLTISEVNEGTPNGDRRSLRIEKNGSGTKERETRKVGGIEFVRADGSGWVRKDDVKRDPNRFTIYGDPAGKELKKFEFAYLGKVPLSGQEVDLYESRKFRSYQLRPDWNHSYTIVERVWIDASGKPVKKQSQTIESNGLTSLDIVWTYTYPEKLTIEAPIP